MKVHNPKTARQKPLPINVRVSKMSENRLYPLRRCRMDMTSNTLFMLMLKTFQTEIEILKSQF